MTVFKYSSLLNTLHRLSHTYFKMERNHFSATLCILVNGQVFMHHVFPEVDLCVAVWTLPVKKAHLKMTFVCFKQLRVATWTLKICLSRHLFYKQVTFLILNSKACARGTAFMMKKKRWVAFICPWRRSLVLHQHKLTSGGDWNLLYATTMTLFTMFKKKDIKIVVTNTKISVIKAFFHQWHLGMVSFRTWLPR